MLEPSDFGLVAIALIVVNCFEIFRDLGIGPALIHRKKDRDIAANTAFYIFPAVAVIFYAVSHFIAPAAVGSLVMVSLVVLLQQLASHLTPALMLVLSIGVGAVSYSVFIRLTQKKEFGEIRELIGGWRGL